MPIRCYARLAFRPVLSVFAAWSVGVASEVSAKDRATQEPAPVTAEGNAAAESEAEGVTRLSRHAEPEGVAWLKSGPSSLSSLASWLWAGPRVAGERPAVKDLADKQKDDPEAVLRSNRARWGTPAKAPEGPVSPELAQLRDRAIRRLQGNSVPVMVAPLDSCKPIDVVEIENLLFADPETADRIFRAAGQGFRVVVLAPVADPNPSPEPQDCPRPAGHGSSSPIADDRAFPEPTPIHQDPEGRVQMRSVPRTVVGNQSGQVNPVIRKTPSSVRNTRDAGGQLLTQPPLVVAPRRGHGPATPAPGLLVPPAPEFDIGSEFPVALSPEPPHVITDLSPSDHLRIAATKLARQGLTDQAKLLRNQAHDLDTQIDRQLAEIRARQQQLAAEAARLTALRDAQKQIRMNALIVEVNRKRMASEAGVALVRRHLGEKFDEKAPFWSQVTAAAVFPEFIREAGQKEFLNVLSRPQVLTVSGQEALIEIGSQFVLPVPGAKAQTRNVGIRLQMTPQMDEGGRLRLEAAPEVSRVDHSNAVTVAGQIIPGIHVRRRQTEVTLSFGQTVAFGGFHSPTPHLETREIMQTAGEVADPHARNYEILFLVTPMAPTESESSTSAAR